MNAFSALKCVKCGAPLPWANARTPWSQSQDELPPNAVRFRPRPPAAIRALAEQQLSAELAAVVKPSPTPYWGATAGLAIFALVSLLLPSPIGYILCPLLLAGAVWAALTANGTLTKGKEEEARQKRLAELCAHLRHVSDGNCPACKQQIMINPSTDPADVPCPSCQAKLHYNQGCVEALVRQ